MAAGVSFPAAVRVLVMSDETEFVSTPPDGRDRSISGTTIRGVAGRTTVSTTAAPHARRRPRKEPR